MPHSYISGSGGSSFEPVPEGVHVARCDLIANIGQQRTEWKGKVNFKNQHVFRWQIPGHRITFEDDSGKGYDRPAIIYQTYTSSLNEKAKLRKHLEAWRGRSFTDAELQQFDLAKVLGAPCQVQIVHVQRDGNTYANINSIMAVPKGMDVPKLEGEAILYDQDDASDTYEQLPEWIRDKLNVHPEDSPAAPADAQTSLDDFEDSSIPF